MAPGYRNQNRRQNRTGYVDHDVFEGLPVRHWRRDYVTVAPPATQENNSTQNDIWAVELPHGMPKDSHLLPQHSQDLLRAARSGKIYKRPAPVEEEEVDVEAVLGEKPEKKEEDPKDKGFTARAWKQIPRHMEGADIEYLAKRRKGLITITAKAAPIGPTLTKTTVKRIDAAGNEYVQDVVVPHGQQVEGEVISQTVIPDSNAIIDPYSVQPTPPKRKGASSRKKLKGPGRGRKKKPTAPTSAPGATSTEEGTSVTAGAELGPDGVKLEHAATATTPANNEDTEMGEGSIANSSDEEGEEGDDNEDDEGSTDNQNSPSKPVAPISPPLNAVSPADILVQNTEFGRPPPKLLTDSRLDVKSGSPLKNVALATSNLTSPLEAAIEYSFPAVAAPILSDDPLGSGPKAEGIVEAIESEILQNVPADLPNPPPAPTQAEVKVGVEERKAEEEEEKMILDIARAITEPEAAKLDITQVEAETSSSAQTIPEEIQAEFVPTKIEVLEDSIHAPIAESDLVSEPIPEAPPEIPDIEEDDDFPDLLGGLEKSLESTRQVSIPRTDLKTEEDGSVGVSGEESGKVESVIGEST